MPRAAPDDGAMGSARGRATPCVPCRGRAGAACHGACPGHACRRRRPPEPPRRHRPAPMVCGTGTSLMSTAAGHVHAVALASSVATATTVSPRAARVGAVRRAAAETTVAAMRPGSVSAGIVRGVPQAAIPVREFCRMARPASPPDDASCWQEGSRPVSSRALTTAPATQRPGSPCIRPLPTPAPSPVSPPRRRAPDRRRAR
jgi:hypothetical protein